MIIDWLYRTTLDTSLLIGLVLLLRPIVRRLFGANVTYLLWLIPLLRVLMVERPERNIRVLESVGIPVESLSVEFITNPDFGEVSVVIPWVAVWSVGLFVWVFARSMTWLRFQRVLLERSSDVTLSSTLVNQLRTRASLNFSKVKMKTCQSPSAPFVTGLFKPAVFLPSDFFHRFTSQERFWVLVHELTHLKRKDLWVQFIGEIVRAVFWFNPIIHFAVQVVREDQELACDNSVLKKCNAAERHEYGKALLVGMGPHLMPSILTFFSKNKERFVMLSKHKVSKLNTVVGMILCAVISVFALTKAPQSIAQRPAFDEVYDADAPVLIRGTIINIDQFDDYSHVYVEAEPGNGGASVWIVEGAGEKVMEEAGITDAIIGRKAVIRGYQSLDKSCDPYCMMNGRDIKFIDG